MVLTKDTGWVHGTDWSLRESYKRTIEFLTAGGTRGEVGGVVTKYADNDWRWKWSSIRPWMWEKQGKDRTAGIAKRSCINGMRKHLTAVKAIGPGTESKIWKSTNWKQWMGRHQAYYTHTDGRKLKLVVRAQSPSSWPWAVYSSTDMLMVNPLAKGETKWESISKAEAEKAAKKILR